MKGEIYLRIIEVFTDGGVFKKEKLSVSIGLIFVDKEKVMTCEKLNFNKESDFAELFAINKILSRAYGYCKQKEYLDDEYIIKVYTDSLTSISSINSEVILSNNERRVQLLNEIKDTINKFDNHVDFYHIKSHISGKNLKIAHKMFCKMNNVDISFNDFLFIAQQNQKCDNLVARAFKKYHKQKKIEAKKRLQLTEEDLDVLCEN